MKLEEALLILKQLVQPTQINDLQELVFEECWQGKTYQQIAELAGYDHDYIRVIGSQLWQILSEHLDTKVSKHNFKVLIRQYQLENISPQVADKQLIIATQEIELEIPEGAVPLDSPFYIERPPIEQQCYQEILKPGALILLKAPSLFGKTSLKKRIVAYSSQSNYHIVKVDFEQADKSLFDNPNQFLRWFCANIARQLQLKPNLDEYWDDDFGSKISCTLYLESYILAQLENPLIIALDHVHVLFEYAQITNNFLPLLRSWYEEAKDAEIWQKLRLIVTYSTDIYVPLNINQSPFNVGLSFRLPEFSQSQIETLAQLHQLANENQTKFIEKLIGLVGGNPYLIRLAMYQIKTQQISSEQLLETATTLSGIYSNHLRLQWTKLQDVPLLLKAMEKIVNTEQSVQIEPIIAHKLESMGLAKFIGDKVIPSCELYRTFFRNQLVMLENYGHRN